MGASNTRTVITTPIAYSSDYSESKDLPRKKIILLGDENVGKSSIIQRFVYDEFYVYYTPTMGCNFECKICDFNGEKSKLIIWDVSGQRRFSTITRPYISGSDLVIIVYNKTNISSVENINYWLDMVKTQIQNPHMVLVGNKADLIDQVQVSTEMGQTFASNHGMDFVEVSALNDMDINIIFKCEYDWLTTCIKKLQTIFY